MVEDISGEWLDETWKVQYLEIQTLDRNLNTVLYRFKGDAEVVKRASALLDVVAERRKKFNEAHRAKTRERDLEFLESLERQCEANNA